MWGLSEHRTGMTKIDCKVS